MPDTHDEAQRAYAPPLSETAAEEHIHGICFKTGPPGRVGVELEWLVRAHGDAAAPADHERVTRALAGLTEAGELPGGGRLTIEPGGQVEISSAPAEGIGSCVTLAGRDLAAVREALEGAGLTLAGLGVDPYRLPARVLDLPRYAAMEQFFDRGGPWGRVMMCSTASVQVCVDAGCDDDGYSGFRWRWRLLHALGPVLVAAFANSPLRAGRLTGWKSTRQAVWAQLDPGRTRAPAGAEPRPAAYLADRNGAGRNGAGRDGAGRNGAGRDGAGRNGAGRDGAGRDGAGRDGAGSSGAGLNSAAGNGAGRDRAGRDSAGSNGAGTNGASPGLTGRIPGGPSRTISSASISSTGSTFSRSDSARPGAGAAAGANGEAGADPAGRTGQGRWGAAAPGWPPNPRGPGHGGADGVTRGSAEGSSRGGAEGADRGGAEGTSRSSAESTGVGGADGMGHGGADGVSRGGAEGSSRGGAEGADRGGAEGTSRSGAESTGVGGAGGVGHGGADGAGRGGADGVSRSGAEGTSRSGAEGTGLGGADGMGQGGAEGAGRGGAGRPGRESASRVGAVLDGAGLTGIGDPRAAWAQYALDAQVMCVQRSGNQGWSAPPDLTFRDWLRGRGCEERPPTQADLAYHLSTLFPPVRPQGHLEVRFIDAQPGDGWIVPAAVVSALADDPVAAQLAMAAAEEVWQYGAGPGQNGHHGNGSGPPGPWLRAARLGLADPVLARAARACFEAAGAALGRAGAPPDIRGRVADFAAEYVLRGRCPADDTLEES